MKLLSYIFLVSLMGINGCQHSRAAEEADAATAIEAALAHTLRPAEDRKRDGDRKPAQVLKFFGVEPGMHTADMMAGGGYYTEILSRALGNKGKVYAQNNAVALGKFAAKAMDKRLNGRDLNNVVRLDRELEDPGLPPGELDVVIMGIFYHDTYWMKVDRKAMNKGIYDALKPGGVFGVIDHSAKKGSGSKEAKRLHRVEEAMVKAEIIAAGFEYVGSTDILRHQEDDRGSNVFGAAIRGKTDRFILKFRKPRKAK